MQLIFANRSYCYLVFLGDVENSRGTSGQHHGEKNSPIPLSQNWLALKNGGTAIPAVGFHSAGPERQGRTPAGPEIANRWSSLHAQYAPGSWHRREQRRSYPADVIARSNAARRF